jgi:hypothetical protein
MQPVRQVLLPGLAMPPLAPPWLALGPPARFGPAVLARRQDEAVARGAREVAAVPAPVAEAREAVPAAVPPGVSTLSRAAAPAAEVLLAAVVMVVPA